MTRAVVFAYHDVGVRCLSVLLAHGVNVELVITHQDNPNEQIWFESVAALARVNDIESIAPERADDPALLHRVKQIDPDFVFSFYYRQMLPAALLNAPRRGALNMHGSLLPKYRGRVPVNWAVIRGEQQTGASLHYMVEKPDAGDLVDQQAVPILPDDTAFDVFRKVTVAAEITLDRSLPALVQGNAPRRALDLGQGSYFGGRKPEDGRIDFTRPAAEVHNLVRGVAPPYPGAFTAVGNKSARVLRTHHAAFSTDRPPGTFFVKDDQVAVACGDARALAVHWMEVEGERISAATLHVRLGDNPVA